MYLGDFSKGKENNLNLIRFLAAFSVLISHSFPLAMGTGTPEPLFSYTGMTLGEVAVDIFFIISGFLVTGSLMLRKDSVEFILSRILRIYPALIIVTLITVFGLGGMFTSIPLDIYLTDNQTLRYVYKNITMITGGAYYLPGVFINNPFPYSVNGSLWTLAWELNMYVILVGIWIILKPLQKKREQYFKVVIIFLACTGMLMFQFNSSYEKLSRFIYLFFAGSAYFVLRKHIKLSKSITFLFIILVFVSVFIDKNIFKIVFSLTMPYILLYISYVPSGFIRKFNNFGDYSYGIYIYAFPVQQSIAAMIPGISVFNLACLASCITFLFSWISWEFIEQPVLNNKKNLAIKLKDFLQKIYKLRFHFSW